MRIGVISDIHGNRVALDAVLNDVETHPVERWICLGDALQGGPQPREVAERLQDLGCPVVLGNADAFLLDAATGERDAAGTDREQQLRLVREWTLAQLGEPGVAFVRTFIPTFTGDLGAAGKLLCFHGGPDDYNEVIAPDAPPAALRDVLGPHGARTMCGGHIHRQWTVSLDDWTFFNPGSVGLAYNFYLPRERFHFTPHAEYAILHIDDDRVAIEFLQVPFDVDELDRAVQANGHPEPGLAQRYRPPA